MSFTLYYQQEHFFLWKKMFFKAINRVLLLLSYGDGKRVILIKMRE